MSKRLIQSALVRKGAQQTKAAHIYYSKYVDGKLAATTHVSHGGSDSIGSRLTGEMARQCKLTKVQFEALIGCTLSADQWEECIRNHPDTRRQR